MNGLLPMSLITVETIQRWDRFYRGNFINSLSGYKPVSLIGTINEKGTTNVGLFSNIVHIGADPALIGFINRPRQAAPHTIANIEANGWFTINHIHPGIVTKAHQCSAKYPEEVSEFLATELTTQFIDPCKAPFVSESKIKYALQLQEIIPISVNQTFLVIGAVRFVQLEDGLVQEDGSIDLTNAQSMCSSGLHRYYEPHFHSHFDYAKP